MSAEDLVLQLRESTEHVKAKPSGDQAAASPLSSSSSPPPASAKNMIIELRRSADLLQGQAVAALTEESSDLGVW